MVDPALNVQIVSRRRAPNGTPHDPILAVHVPAPTIEAIRIEAARHNAKPGNIIAVAMAHYLNSKAREQAA